MCAHRIAAPFALKMCCVRRIVARVVKSATIPYPGTSHTNHKGAARFLSKSGAQILQIVAAYCICTNFNTSITTRRNSSEHWIFAADSVRTSNLHGHAAIINFFYIQTDNYYVRAKFTFNQNSIWTAKCPSIIYFVHSTFYLCAYEQKRALKRAR